MNDSIVNDIMNDLNKPDREKPEIKEYKKKILKRLKERPNYNKDVLKKLVENQVILSKKKRLANYSNLIHYVF